MIIYYEMRYDDSHLKIDLDQEKCVDKRNSMEKVELKM